MTLRCDGESCRTANTGKADAIPDYIFTRVIHDFAKIAKLIADGGTVMIEKTRLGTDVSSRDRWRTDHDHLSRMQEETYLENWQRGARHNHIHPRNREMGR